MKRTRTLITTAIAVSLLATGAPAGLAQSEAEMPDDPAYFTIEWGEQESFVPPAEENQVPGGIEMRGLARIGIEVMATDPRISGSMTVFVNGSGVQLPDGGHSNLEAHRVRIENADGAWSGTGISNFVVDGGDELVFDNVVYVLEGEDAYEGMSAYILSDGVLRQSQGVIYGLGLPPTPDPILAE